MKRLIILQLGYETGPAVRAKAFKQFREDLKSLPFLKILKEYEPRAEVLIEYPEDKFQEMFDELRKLDVVQTIDNTLPKDEQEDSPANLKK